MLRIISIIASMYIFFSSSSALALNATMLNACKSTLYGCVETLYNVTTNFSNCTTEFDLCLGEVLHVEHPWPQECYRADAAWDNCWISIGGFIAILGFNNLFVPAASKGAAWAMTQCMNCDRERHPIIRRCGDIFKIFFDENRNNEILAGEIFSPQAFITFAGLSLPFYYAFIAMDWQAQCDFAKAVLKCSIPGFDDDDFCHP